MSSIIGIVYTKDGQSFKAENYLGDILNTLDGQGKDFGKDSYHIS